MKYDNYWFSTSSAELNYSLSLPEKVDIAIIGGGFGGIALLFQLLRHGFKNVVLLEEYTLGFKNTGRSTGQITLTGGSQYFTQYKDKKFANEYLKMTLQSIRQLNKSLEPLDCDFEQAGGLHLAKKEEELEFLKGEAEFLNNHDVCAVHIDKKDVKNLIGSDMFIGGIFIPCEATINPYKMFLSTKKQLNGFQNLIYQNAKVEYVDNHDLLIAERGVLKADKIVYCSGPKLIPKLKTQTQNVFHQVVTSAKGNVPNMNVTYNYNSNRIRTHNGHFLLDCVSKSRKIIDTSLLQKQMDELALGITGVCSYNEVVSKDGIPLVGSVSDHEFVMLGHDLSQACLGAASILNCIKSGKQSQLFNPLREM